MAEFMANEEKKSKAINVANARSLIAGKSIALAAEMGDIVWSELS